MALSVLLHCQRCQRPRMPPANRAPDSNVVALPVTDAERQRRYRERLRSGALIAKSTVSLEMPSN